MYMYKISYQMHYAYCIYMYTLTRKLECIIAKAGGVVIICMATPRKHMTRKL